MSNFFEFNEIGYEIHKNCVSISLIKAWENYFYNAMIPKNIKTFKPGFSNSEGDFKQLRDVVHNQLFNDTISELEVSGFFHKLLGKRMGYVSHGKLSFKKPHTQSSWIPHSDYAYKTSKAAKGFTIALALEAHGPFNGGLELFPGTHRVNYPHQKIYFGEANDYQVGVQEPIKINETIIFRNSIELDAGDIAIWDLNLLHSSGVNATLESLRPTLIFEVRFDDIVLDDESLVPVIINGRLSFFDYIYRKIKSMIIRGKRALKVKIKFIYNDLLASNNKT